MLIKKKMEGYKSIVDEDQLRDDVTDHKSLIEDLERQLKDAKYKSELMKENMREIQETKFEEKYMCSAEKTRVEYKDLVVSCCSEDRYGYKFIVTGCNPQRKRYWLIKEKYREKVEPTKIVLEAFAILDQEPRIATKPCELQLGN